MNMIKLKFQIIIDKNGEDIEIYYEQDFNEEILFGEAIKVIYDKFSVEKLNEENLNNYGYCAYIYNPSLIDINYCFVGLAQEPEMFEYNDISLKDLENQFGISNKIFEVCLDPMIGGDVGRCRGIHFFFHTNEKDLHHVPHIHCRCAEEEFRVNLVSLQPMDITFKNRKRTSFALNAIKSNKEELMKYWNNVVVKGESLKLKMYFPCR